MTISFIIPVCNCEAYLRKCVERLLSVQNPEIEVLLVDDGSTDGSGILCDALQNEDSRVRVFHQDNKGVSAARNRGIEAATGAYLRAFLHRDCASIL